MKRFHFMNNEALDNNLLSLCEVYQCETISNLINRILFCDIREFLIFMNHYCQKNVEFKTVKKCTIRRKISIPEVIYFSMKLCHEEFNTYSIALIWRSFLIDLVECIERGGLDEWEKFKRHVLDIGIMQERKLRKNNRVILRKINSVHIPGILRKNISKIGFYTFGNEFMGYLRC